VSAQSSSASGSTPLPPDEYQGLIERLRETADSIIPRNATVLVVSRGDDELLHMGARRALHFPQDEFGRYRGYHPEDSEAAIAILENMRTRGAEYFLLPSTSFWWLDYYEGFGDHLESNYSRLVSGDDCTIFELTATGVQSAASDADTETMSAASSRRLAGPLDELLRALLPADARIAVVTAGGADLPSFRDCTAVQPPDGGDGVAALLARASAGGAQFLVIPAIADDPANARGESPNGFDGWRLVTRQQYLGEVYERHSELAVGRSQLAGAGTANRELRTANPGFWRRLVNFFRR
jgi:hypothetical protein